MARRPDKEMFLEAIELNRNERGFATNAAVQGELGWTSDRYSKVRERLLAEHEIRKGGGQGGSVGIIGGRARGLSARSPTSIFISYSHADEEIKKRLIQHMEPLRHRYGIIQWNDRQIKPGENISDQVFSNLNSADIFLLLVSADFLASQYCYEKELARALELHGEERLRVVPIIVSPCSWKLTPLAELLALPDDGKPIKSFSDQEEAYVEVVSGLTGILEEVTK